MDICVTFLDVKKVFDSVPYALLDNKLRNIGLHVNLLAWLTDDQTLWKQQVVVEGTPFDIIPVTSGVP